MKLAVHVFYLACIKYGKSCTIISLFSFTVLQCVRVYLNHKCELVRMFLIINIFISSQQFILFFCHANHFVPERGFKSRSLKVDLHGTILSHTTSLRHAYDTF